MTTPTINGSGSIGDSDAAATGITFPNYTVNSGTDRMMWAIVSSVGDVTAVTFDGDSLTKYNDGEISQDLANLHVFTLAAPGVKTGDVEVTAGAGKITLIVVVTDDTDQTTPVAAFDTAFTNAGTSVSLTFSGSGADNLIIDALAVHGATPDVTGGQTGGTTSIQSIETAGAGADIEGHVSQIAGSASDVGPIGYESTDGNNHDWAYLTMAIQAPAAGSDVTVNLGLSGETDAANAFNIIRNVALGLSSETDVANAITIGGQIILGIASETDQATVLSILKRVSLGLSSETDAAILMTIAQNAGISLSGETSSALSMTPVHRVLLGVATETDVALRLDGQVELTTGGLPWIRRRRR